MTLEKCLDSGCSSSSLVSVIESLPLSQVEEDAWDTFLQSEKENRFIDFFFPSGVSHDDEHVCRIADALGRLADILEFQNVAENGDTFFWNALAESRSFSTEAAFPGSIARPQALLLLLTECIYGEDTGAFFAASRVFLCLCQCGKAVEHFFGPNLFIGRKIVSPLRSVRPPVSMRSDSQEDVSSPGCGVDEKSASHVPASLTLTSEQSLKLIRIFGLFLKRVTCSFLQLDLGRELIAAVTDALVQCLLTTAVQDDKMKDAIASTLIDFVLRMNQVRCSSLQLAGDQPSVELPSSDSVFLESSQSDTSGCISQPTANGKPLVLTNDGRTAVDPLVFSVGCFLRPLVYAFVCRPTHMSIGVAQCPNIPKRILAARQTAIRFVRALLCQVPELLDVDQLSVVSCKRRWKGVTLKGQDVNTALSQRKKRMVRSGKNQDEDGNSVIESENEADDEQRQQPVSSSLAQSAECPADNASPAKRDMEELLEASANDPLCAFLARACILVPDRREPRDLLASGVAEILSPFSLIAGARSESRDEKRLDDINCKIEALKRRFAIFLQTLMDFGRLSALRTVAVEVSSCLLDSLLVQPTMYCFAPASFLSAVDVYHGLLMRIVQRIRDVQPGTRARSLECLASLVLTASATQEASARVLKMWNHADEKQPGSAEHLVAKLYLSFLSGCFPGLFPSCTLPLVDLAAIIRDRAADQRQLVRKSALTCARNVAFFLVNASILMKLPDNDLQLQLQRHGITDSRVLGPLFSDPSLQVRAKAITTLHDVLGVAPLRLRSIRRLWLSNVLPAIRDPEKSVMDKALDYVRQLIVEGITQYGRDLKAYAVDKDRLEKATHPSSTAWSLLELATVEDLDYIGRGLQILHKNDSACSPLFVNSLEEALRMSLPQCTAGPVKTPMSVGERLPLCPIFALCHIIKDVVGLEKESAPVGGKGKRGFSLSLLCATWMEQASHLLQASAVFSLEELSSSNCFFEFKKEFQLTFAMQFLLTAIEQKLGFAQLENEEQNSQFFSICYDVVASLKAPLPLLSPLLLCLRALGLRKKGMNAKDLWIQPLLKRLESVLLGYAAVFLPKHGVSRDDTVDAPAWGAVSAAVNGCPTEIEVARSLLIMGDLALLYNDILGPSSTTSAAKSASYVICADVLTVIHAIATADGAAGCREEHTSRSAQHSAVTPSCFLSNSVKQLNVSLPDLIRAQAIVCLGKFCLVKEQLAKKLIDALSTQLNGRQPDVVRCNALAVFADFCVRYAFLADRYLLQFSMHLGAGGLSSQNGVTPSSGAVKPWNSAAWGDNSPLVRKQCLCLIAGLIAQDFIKCKGLLVFRLLTCLGDPVPSIRRLAESVVTHILMPRQANFIQNHVVEMICFMCSWPGHPVLKAANLGGPTYVKKNSPFCFLNHARRRQYVYAFFLQHMTDKDRHELSRRLVHNFLGAFVDTAEDDTMTQRPRRQLELPRSACEPAGAALRDALKLLGCKQMKITFRRQRQAARGNHEEDAENIEQGLAGAGSTAAVASPNECGEAAYELNLLKRNLAYQILPTLLSLKRVMEDARSMFLGDILQCLKALLYDYRDELSDILFHDPILAKQLDFDFKRNAVTDVDFFGSTSNHQEATEEHGSNALMENALNTGGRRSLLLEGCPTTGASLYSEFRNTNETAFRREVNEPGQSEDPQLIRCRQKQRRGSIGCWPSAGIEVSGLGTEKRAATMMSLPRLRKEAAALLSESRSRNCLALETPTVSAEEPALTATKPPFSHHTNVPATQGRQTTSAFLTHLGLAPSLDAPWPGLTQPERQDDGLSGSVNPGRCNVTGSSVNAHDNGKENIAPSCSMFHSEVHMPERDILEQELVLSALRSSKRRHSLPSAGYYSVAQNAVTSNLLLTSVGQQCRQQSSDFSDNDTMCELFSDCEDSAGAAAADDGESPAMFTDENSYSTATPAPQTSEKSSTTAARNMRVEPANFLPNNGGQKAEKREDLNEPVLQGHNKELKTSDNVPSSRERRTFRKGARRRG